MKLGCRAGGVAVHRRGDRRSRELLQSGLNVLGPPRKQSEFTTEAHLRRQAISRGQLIEIRDRWSLEVELESLSTEETLNIPIAGGSSAIGPVAAAAGGPAVSGPAVSGLVPSGLTGAARPGAARRRVEFLWLTAGQFGSYIFSNPLPAGGEAF